MNTDGHEWQGQRRGALGWLWVVGMLGCLVGWGVTPEVEGVVWQQVGDRASFRVFADREEYSTLDRWARFVAAVQVGNEWGKPEELSAAWSVTRDGTAVCQGTASLATGMVAVTLPLAELTPGTYQIRARLLAGDAERATAESFFRYVEEKPPAQAGRIRLLMPRGVPEGVGAWPVTGGVPFPKGALWDAANVRVETADGAGVPCQTIVRSRWGASPASSIRWLGIDFQAKPGTAYELVYGPGAKGEPAGPTLKLTESPAGIAVDTGAMTFTVSRAAFALFEQVTVGGKPVTPGSPTAGLYLVDQEGSVYRAANDRETKLSIEEQGPLRAVIRAEGWYVKDGTAGDVMSYTLPTDKLCKFVCRLEVYAGKAVVRVLNTWVITADTYTVRFRDVGVELPMAGLRHARFGVDGQAVEGSPAQGVRLVQHLPDACVVENGDGAAVASGQRSDGWLTATGDSGAIGISLRDTWQRFPKELEVLGNGVRLHVWPAHGKDHPELDTLAANEIHKLWFAHQGKELNLAQPWETYFRVAQIEDDPSQGVYDGAGLALAGVHASAMGTAITSDFMVSFGPGDDTNPLQAFQAAPAVLADPEWACASGSFGWVHPKDTGHFASLEEIIDETMRGYWQTQNDTGEYGMWLYRAWHHTTYKGEGQWKLYRLYNASHHYDAFMPWLFYARSGDPFYLTEGMANIRMLTDVQMIHYDDPTYPHHEFHFGQKRLIGSMKHTNGFNTWGGDHAVLAHLTCYNAIMMAYYLTGDLRLREVVVDEWQKTLLTDRANPQFAKADRSGRTELNGARDTTNALAELIDLYQLTHEPALLGLMAPMMDIFLNYHMRHWGQPLHHALQYYKSRQAADQLLAAVDEYRATLGKPTDPKNVWYTHSPHENWALAAILQPDKGYQVDAYFACDTGRWLARTRDILDEKPMAVTWCTVPDLLLYLPRVEYAIAHSTDGFALNHLDASQAFPAGDNTNAGWTRTVVREAADQAWTVTLMGTVAEPGLPLQVIAPDGSVAARTTVPPGVHNPWRLSVPADGQTGDYVVFIKAVDNKDKLRVPLTDLPEVCVVGYWSQMAPTRFFTRSPGDEPIEVGVQPHKSRGTILSADMRTSLAATDTGEPMQARIGPDGAWIGINARYVRTDSPLTLAVSPDRWFAPSAAALAVKPQP